MSMSTSFDSDFNTIELRNEHVILKQKTKGIQKEFVHQNETS